MEEVAMPTPALDDTTSKVISISSQIMIATIVVLFFVIAFCVFLHLYFKCCYTNTEDPSVVSWRRQFARQRAPAQRRGLDLTTLRSLPVVVYNPKDFKDGLECAVCLSEVSEGEKARLLPKCNHGFHVECIDMWFQSHSTCPLCRDPVISSTSNQSNDTANDHSNVEVHDDHGSYSSESEFYSDSDDSGSYHSARVTEVPVFPTNVLFWGNETQVSSFGQAANAAASSSGVSRPSDHELVIEIPSHHEFYEDCLSSLSLPPLVEEVKTPVEGAKTPVVSRLRSLKRLLSMGKRVASSPSGSTSCDVDQQV